MSLVGRIHPKRVRAMSIEELSDAEKQGFVLAKDGSMIRLSIKSEDDSQSSPRTPLNRESIEDVVRGSLPMSFAGRS